MKDIYEVPYKTKYGYLFEQYCELAELWSNPETHKFITVKGSGNSRQHLLKIQCSTCGNFVDNKYGGFLRYGDIREAYIRQGRYICQKCYSRSQIKSVGVQYKDFDYRSSSSKKAMETMGLEGLRARKSKAEETIGLERRHQIMIDVASKRDPVLMSNIARERMQKLIDSGNWTNPQEGRSKEDRQISAKLAISRQTKEQLSLRAKKALQTNKLNGTGWFSEEAKRKLAESNNKRREERGYTWANESEIEQEKALKFGGICGLQVYCPLDGKCRWPDIVFPDGHVICWDDKSHKIDIMLTKPDWNRSLKHPTYEQEYDLAMIDLYGKRPLHIIQKQDATMRRERFDTVDDLIVAYLNDELRDDEFIMLGEPLYEGIRYELSSCKV